MQLSIVIPCYNEEAVLPDTYIRVTAAAQQTVGNDYEILLINDGSNDNTWTLIKHYCEQDFHIKGILFSRNFGHQAALNAGLQHAQGDRIFILDADLQDPPELLPHMMQAMDAGADVVYGKRTARKHESAFKKISALLFYRLLAQLADIEIPLDTGDFRLISRRVRDAFFSMPEKQQFIRGMIAWTGFKQVPLEYERQPRFAGHTKYPLHKMLAFAANAIASFSISPLRISVFLALIFAIVGSCALGYVLFSWLVLDYVRGWTSLAGIVCILGSAQLLVLGIMGEYIGRIYMEAKGRPLYVIQDIYTEGYGKGGGQTDSARG